ncbi:MAG: GlxA family transcriptional regulator [Kordiimonas sp.]
MKTDKVIFSVGFVLLDEFTLFAFSGFVDALRIAGDQSDDSRQRDFSWTIVAPTMEPIKSNSGVEVLPWETYSAGKKYDYLVVVGGRVEPQRKTNSKIIEYIQKFSAAGGCVVGLCTASFVLARAGLMKERKSCVHWHHRQEFEEEFPDLEATSDTVFIEDNQRITSPGGRAASDVALYLIEKHCGPAKARKAASGLMIEEIRTSHSPQPNVGATWFKEIRNPLLRRAIIVMDQSIGEELSMEDLAARLRVGENSLFRAFKRYVGVSPAKLLRVLRLAHAHWTLHNTSMAIAQIAHLYQFSDASHFSKIHREFYGVTPAEARIGGPNIRPKGDGEQSLIVRRILEGELFLLDDRIPSINNPSKLV